MNYKQLNDLILDTFSRVPTVNSVTNNSLDWNVHKDVKYPAVAADLQNVQVTDGVANYNYHLTAAKIGVESEADRVSNYSNMMQVLYEGLEYLKDGSDVDIDGTYTFNFGSLKFMDVLDCATCQVTISTEAVTDCELQAYMAEG